MERRSVGWFMIVMIRVVVHANVQSMDRAADSLSHPCFVTLLIDFHRLSIKACVGTDDLVHLVHQILPGQDGAVKKLKHLVGVRRKVLLPSQDIQNLLIWSVMAPNDAFTPLDHHVLIVVLREPPLLVVILRGDRGC